MQLISTQQSAKGLDHPRRSCWPRPTLSGAYVPEFLSIIDQMLLVDAKPAAMFSPSVSHLLHVWNPTSSHVSAELQWRS